MMETEQDFILWFQGYPPWRIPAYEGDGLKIYPNPAREFSGGTVQHGISPTLNTYNGCGVGTVVRITETDSQTDSQEGQQERTRMEGQEQAKYPIERKKWDPKYTLERVIDVLRETNYVGDPPKGWETIYGNVMFQPPEDATFEQIVNVVRVITEITKTEGGRDMTITCSGDLIWFHMTPEEADKVEDGLRKVIGADDLYDKWAFVYDDDFPENYRRTPRHRMRVLLAEHPRSEGRVVRRGRHGHVRGLLHPQRGLLTIPIEPVGKPLTSFIPRLPPEKRTKRIRTRSLNAFQRRFPTLRNDVF